MHHIAFYSTTAISSTSHFTFLGSVPLQKFVDTAIENHADLICMSTLMTTTMGGMETVINLLKEAGIRDQVKVMIGGGPISQKFADKIGADSYTANAVEAVKAAKEMLNIA